MSGFFPTWAAQRAASRIRFAEYQRIGDLQQKRLSQAAYAGADKNRRNRDWNPRRGSADQAILSNFDTMLVRARSLGRDNWAAKSIRAAFERNVIGRGIIPIATAKDKSGEEINAYNEALDNAFMYWASRREHCDVAKKQTYWQKQKMAVGEMVEVGEHFIVWSYKPNDEACGLQLQSFEPEQLDIVKLQNPDTGNFIRRGIEVDDNGAPVAYYFYKRPLNDWFPFLPAGATGTLFTESERIPAERVIHIMQQDRSRQTHGITWYAPSMNKLRDTYTCDDATLQTMKLEAAISLIVTREDAGSEYPNRFGGSLPPRDTDGTTQSGAPLNEPGIPDNISRDGGAQYAIEPAMVFTGKPGEKVTGVQKQTPGNTYDSYMKSNLRASAAGCRLSYDVVARDYDGGNYNSKRQGALEDRREYSTSQDMAVDVLCTIVFEMFVKFSILEEAIKPGRYKLGVTLADYLADPRRYSDAEHIPDGFEWVDPKKESDAASVMLDKRLITRKELAARAGRNWRRIFQQIANEQKEAARLGITLPDVEPTPPTSAGDGIPPSAAPGAQSPKPKKPQPDEPDPDESDAPDQKPAEGGDRDEDDGDDLPDR